MIMFNTRYNICPSDLELPTKKHSISLSSYINLSLLSPYKAPLYIQLKHIGNIPKSTNSPGVNFNNSLSSII